jgi:hypothetical protein
LNHQKWQKFLFGVVMVDYVSHDTIPMLIFCDFFDAALVAVKCCSESCHGSLQHLLPSVGCHSSFVWAVLLLTNAR